MNATMLTALQVYIDGSYRRGRAHYAVLVDENSLEIACLAGVVRPHLHGFPGRVRSNDCEVFAALVALDWLARHRPGAAATIFTDSDTVAQALVIRPLDEYVCYLQQCLRSLPVQVVKVKAHAGCPRNEYADRLAKRGVVALRKPQVQSEAVRNLV